MNLTIHPGRSIQGIVASHGEISLPGDKSLSHRAAILSAMAVSDSKIDNFQVSGVTRVMLDALTQLNIPWILDNQRLSVEGRGLRSWSVPSQPIFCGNSATTIRLLAGALAAGGVPVILDGSAGLRRRPMDRIVDPLQQMGVAIHSTGGCAPLELQRSPMPLKALEYTLPVASAQVKTCLLLAALSADGATILHEPGPSRDHTERMLRSLGVQIESTLWDAKTGDMPMITTRLTLPRGGFALPGLHMFLPGDPSAAAFLVVAALITPDSLIRLEGVLLNPTRTGLLDVLLSMGAKIDWQITGQTNGEPTGWIEAASSDLKATQVRGPLVVRMIDEFPAFAVAAACAEGKTVVCEAEELRTKESDRIAALAGELRKIGVVVHETADGFEIDGGRGFSGGMVQSHGDHRLAMSLAVAGLRAKSAVTVEDAQVIGESFPSFVAIVRQLGADIEVG